MGDMAWKVFFGVLGKREDAYIKINILEDVSLTCEELDDMGSRVIWKQNLSDEVF